MGELWTASCLSSFFTHQLQGRMRRGEGLVLCATLPQKHTLKRWLLKTNGGLLGWEVLTLGELKRQKKVIMARELSLWAASLMEAPSLEAAKVFIRDLSGWLMAGYTVGAIAFPAAWKKIAQTIMAGLKENNLTAEWDAEVLPAKPIILVGFDSMEAHSLLRGRKQPDDLILLIEPPMPSVGQAAAYNTLAKHSNEAGRYEPAPIAQLPFVVEATADLLPAIIKALEEYPAIERIVWQGDAAQAAVGMLGAQLPLATLAQAPTPWGEGERMNAYRHSQKEGSPTAILESLRQEQLTGRLEAKGITEATKAAQLEWQNTGVLPVGPFAAQQARLGDTATIKEFIEKTQESLSVDLEHLAEVLAPLEKVITTPLARSLWLEYLPTPVAQKENLYAPLAVLPLEAAWGLVDGNTLLLLSPAPARKTLSLISLADQRANNRASVENNGAGAETLSRGWLGNTQALLSSQTQQMALEASVVVALKGVVLPQTVVMEGGFTRQETITNGFETLTAVHKTRHDTHAPLGVYDYALPTPIRASAKRWEEVALKPALAWYSLLKLTIQWAGQQETPNQLWVGNWVHEALKKYPTEPLENFFAPLRAQANACLEWRNALARAEMLAERFAAALENGLWQTVEIEKEVEGVVNFGQASVSVRGRIDRVLRNEAGEFLIIDYKTAKGAKKINANLAKGDGLQLWLYARLLKAHNPQATFSVCRLIASEVIEIQKTLTEEMLAIEELLADVARTGVLGHAGKLAGRFSDEERVPYATLPLEETTAAVRRKGGYENA